MKKKQLAWILCAKKLSEIFAVTTRTFASQKLLATCHGFGPPGLLVRTVRTLHSSGLSAELEDDSLPIHAQASARGTGFKACHWSASASYLEYGSSFGSEQPGKGCPLVELEGNQGETTRDAVSIVIPFWRQPRVDLNRMV